MKQITIIGNIGRDAERREVNGQIAISFSVAVNSGYKDSNGNKVDKVDWYRCTYWPQTEKAARMQEYFLSGTRIFVQGIPSVSTYQDKQGKTAVSQDVRVDKFELLSKRETATDEQPAAAQIAQQAAQPMPPAVAVPENVEADDLPF